MTLKELAIGKTAVGQIRDQRIRIPAYLSVLTVHRDPGEISHMLFRAGQLVKEGRKRHGGHAGRAGGADLGGQESGR